MIKRTSKPKKTGSAVLKVLIISAVFMMLLSVMPSEGALRNTCVSNGDSKSRIEKIYKVTKITLPCNICKLVLK